MRIISTVKKLYDHNKLTAIYILVTVGFQWFRSESLEEKWRILFSNGKSSNFQKDTNILHHFYKGSVVAGLQTIKFIERHFINIFPAPVAWMCGLQYSMSVQLHSYMWLHTIGKLLFKKLKKNIYFIWRTFV
jgi:hypothetical protein